LTQDYNVIKTLNLTFL